MGFEYANLNEITLTMKTKDPKNVARGKKAKAAGARFEKRVQVDLEKKGWIAAKWSKNVEFGVQNKGVVTTINSNVEAVKSEWDGKLVNVKNKFLGPGKPMMLGAGFPDFIAFKNFTAPSYEGPSLVSFEVIAVEAKSTGYLKPEEKEKCVWLLENNIFNKILIAYKGKKRGEILYKEFK